MFFFDKTKDKVPEDYVMVNMENAQKDNSFSPYSILLMYKDMINAGKLPETAIKYILEYLQNYEEMISEDYKEYIKLKKMIIIVFLIFIIFALQTLKIYYQVLLMFKNLP